MFRNKNICLNQFFIYFTSLIIMIYSAVNLIWIPNMCMYKQMKMILHSDGAGILSESFCKLFKRSEEVPFR